MRDIRDEFTPHHFQLANLRDIPKQEQHSTVRTIIFKHGHTVKMEDFLFWIIDRPFFTHLFHTGNSFIHEPGQLIAPLDFMI
ncbi:hypothetical protein D3C85_1602840 [compost metagenome]